MDNIIEKILDIIEFCEQHKLRLSKIILPRYVYEYLKQQHMKITNIGISNEFYTFVGISIEVSETNTEIKYILEDRY